MFEPITHFFTWNGTYLCPNFDQDTCLEEMRSGYVENARCCTPLLVNASCAVESVGLPVSTVWRQLTLQTFVQGKKQFEVITEQNLPGRFFEEAKKLV